MMIPMGTQTDEWVAVGRVLRRHSFGNTRGPRDRRRREAGASGTSATRKTPWTVGELEGTLPQAIAPDPRPGRCPPAITPGAAMAALSLSGWSSQTPQAPGMWFQIELPQPATVAEFSSSRPVAGAAGAEAAGRGRPRRTGRSAARASASQHRLSARVQGRDVDEWHEVDAGGDGEGTGTEDDHHIQTDTGEIRPADGDGDDRGAPPLSIQQLRVFEAGSK